MKTPPNQLIIKDCKSSKVSSGFAEKNDHKKIEDNFFAANKTSVFFQP